MLLVDGTRNLIGQTRLYAGDPSTAPVPRLTDAQWKNLINAEYLSLRDVVRVPDVGYSRKFAYVDGAAISAPEDELYDLPADYVARLRVEVSASGANLSTALPAAAETFSLSSVGYDQALDHYYVDGSTEIKYYAIFDRQFLISAPLTATEAGTKTIKLTYEASTVELSDDADEPDLPRPHHELIAMGAALRGGVADGLDIGDLERRYEIAKVEFRRAAWDTVADYDAQITVIGRTPTTRSTNIGRVRRRG